MKATEQKNKRRYRLFKIAGIVVSCILPIWGVYVKFPLWSVNYGAGKTIGVGAILMLVILTVVFRRTVFKFIVDKLKLKHAPPITIWLVFLVLAYTMIYVANFLRDLVLVLWLGVFGCAAGSLLMLIGEVFFGEEDKK